MEKIKSSDAIKIGIFGGITTTLILRYAGDYKWYILAGVSVFVLIFVVYFDNRKK